MIVSRPRVLTCIIQLSVFLGTGTIWFGVLLPSRLTYSKLVSGRRSVQSRLPYRTSELSYFMVFPSHFRQIRGSDENRFLPNPFQFIVQLSPYHPECSYVKRHETDFNKDDVSAGHQRNKQYLISSYHSSGYEELALCSPLKVNSRFGGTRRLHFHCRRISKARIQLCLPPACTLVSCLSYSSTLKMEVTCSSETSVDFQRTT
jgi:hypothetical protein